MHVDFATEPMVRFGVIKEAWRLYRRHAMTWSLAVLIVMIANAFVNGALHAVLYRGERLGLGGFRLLLPATDVVRFTAATMVTGFFVGGMIRMAGRQIRGGTPRLDDLFSITDCWFDLLLVSFLIGAGTSIGFTFFVVPGLVISGLCMLAIPLVAEGRLPATAAIIASWRALSSQWLTASVFHWVLIILAVSGVTLCFVGVFATGPLYCLALAILYHEFFGWGAVPASKKPGDPFPEV